MPNSSFYKDKIFIEIYSSIHNKNSCTELQNTYKIYFISLMRKFLDNGDDSKFPTVIINKDDIKYCINNIHINIRQFIFTHMMNYKFSHSYIEEDYFR